MARIKPADRRYGLNYRNVPYKRLRRFDKSAFHLAAVTGRFGRAGSEAYLNAAARQHAANLRKLGYNARVVRWKERAGVYVDLNGVASQRQTISLLPAQSLEWGGRHAKLRKNRSWSEMGTPVFNRRITRRTQMLNAGDTEGDAGDTTYFDQDREMILCKNCETDYGNCGCYHGELECAACGEWTYPIHYDPHQDGCNHCSADAAEAYPALSPELATLNREGLLKKTRPYARAELWWSGASYDERMSLLNAWLPLMGRQGPPGALADLGNQSFSDLGLKQRTWLSLPYSFTTGAGGSPSRRYVTAHIMSGDNAVYYSTDPEGREVREMIERLARKGRPFSAILERAVEAGTAYLLNPYSAEAQAGVAQATGLADAEDYSGFAGHGIEPATWEWDDLHDPSVPSRLRSYDHATQEPDLGALFLGREPEQPRTRSRPGLLERVAESDIEHLLLPDPDIEHLLAAEPARPPTVRAPPTPIEPLTVSAADRAGAWHTALQAFAISPAGMDTLDLEDTDRTLQALRELRDGTGALSSMDLDMDAEFIDRTILEMVAPEVIAQLSVPTGAVDSNTLLMEQIDADLDALFKSAESSPERDESLLDIDWARFEADPDVTVTHFAHTDESGRRLVERYESEGDRDRRRLDQMIHLEDIGATDEEIIEEMFARSSARHRRLRGGSGGLRPIGTDDIEIERLGRADGWPSGLAYNLRWSDGSWLLVHGDDARYIKEEMQRSWELSNKGNMAWATPKHALKAGRAHERRGKKWSREEAFNMSFGLGSAWHDIAERVTEGSDDAAFDQLITGILEEDWNTKERYDEALAAGRYDRAILLSRMAVGEGTQGNLTWDEWGAMSMTEQMQARREAMREGWLEEHSYEMTEQEEGEHADLAREWKPEWTDYDVEQYIKAQRKRYRTRTLADVFLDSDDDRRGVT
jgi:hypothetical protein